MRRGLCAALLVCALAAPPTQAAERPHFHTCRDAAPGARCGHVRVPLDRLAAGSPKIRIGFELYRRRDRTRPSLGTMVDVEGGPGRGRFRAHWNVRWQLATATLAGRLDGHRLRATMLAP